ncbi:unnamed protein product [Ambrosiozyma monospora]|uniref:Unnamed protein product n=1 Tax=Ambrosiozyma monospora TaxID=43982 RepID=A0ACB5U4E7_AMBMO|nr:unnamed protein product [Ambrosiozyma monospora]
MLSKLAKDGLHQYKKNVQTYDGGLESVSKITTQFLDLAEKSLKEAHSKAENVQLDDAVDTNEDDEDGETLSAISPEDILLSAVSTDDSKDRSDRELVVPWLRFLWDAYRTVLDVLRNNSKLEQAYCNVASRAFSFCAKYERKTELRRLCELLRAHLQTVSQKPSDKYQVANPVDLTNPDTLHRFLDTRLEQLNTAVKLELWQESYRTVEDFHNL